jgi:hypothetical protein
MLDDYFNGCARARSLSTTAEIKMIRELSLVFTDLWFDTYILFMCLPSEKYKIVSLKKKGFEYLDDLLVYFRPCFIIAKDSLCIFTMYI